MRKIDGLGFLSFVECRTQCFSLEIPRVWYDEYEEGEEREDEARGTDATMEEDAALKCRSGKGGDGGGTPPIILLVLLVFVFCVCVFYLFNGKLRVWAS